MQDNKQSTNHPAVSGGLVPDIVKEIPVAMPDAKSRPASEDDELDKIMRDVGQDIRQIGKKKPKNHWFNRTKKAKHEPQFSARPDIRRQPVPAEPVVQIKHATPANATPAPKPQITANAKPAKPPKTSSAPVGVILLAILVTGALSLAAYFAYK